ncbi:YciE/YciF ferroxidase family protein [Mucilaginibacter terrae]|uniref:Ferritin-like metal-binding protein YciE n=1 Tax=Mucilaginibacter terrae TaxID=1955052 RepID=A0ABU3GX96_9SPHI|nr:ferritin-like domain-containing protein [Mucilaginibacter terrae]MDT3403295.1 ferritin-like metal-binding protein YciE [Mucilaginibacter terrae]
MATTKSKKQPATTENVEESALKELFVDELKDIYWAEKHLSKALVKLAKAATSEELRSALETHKEETDNQVARLDQVFEIIGEKASAKKCDAMEGLIKESESIVEDTEDGSITRDAGIISAAQKSEHYEIASYGTLRTLANTLGYSDAAQLLEETLAEEKKTDEMLTQLAESMINATAKTEKA